MTPMITVEQAQQNELATSLVSVYGRDRAGQILIELIAQHQQKCRNRYECQLSAIAVFALEVLLAGGDS